MTDQPPIETIGAVGSSAGTPSCRRLVNAPTNSERTNDAPIAVMRKASGGALRARSGR